MSFQENAWPRTSMTGSVNCTIKAMVLNKPRRRISAMPIPIRRALARCCWGSLLVRIEMKIRLSMPSTISITTRVARAIHAVGLAASCKR
ncbi:hypothetical protein D3C84_1073470 [compost metagenome]